MSFTSRRSFLQQCALAGSTVYLLNGAAPKTYFIESVQDGSLHRRLAERELLRGLTLLQIPGEVRLTASLKNASGDGFAFRLRVNKERFKDKEGYSIERAGQNITLSAASEIALVYAVLEFMERQGVYFGVDGENYPPELAGTLVLPVENKPWEASPRFAVRGLLPWPDFLNCITVFNDEDFQAYFEAMLRMRFNTFGMHVYTSPESTSAGAESYLSFDFAGSGHQAFLDNSGSQRWGYLPERTSHFGMGGPQYFSGEVFGTDATTLSHNPWEIADRTRELLRRSFAYAKKLGIATGIGFEPYQVPDATLRALPPEIKPKPGARLRGGAAFDVESVVARRMLEARLAELLDAYPDVEYVWLWEDENMNWESRKTGVPLSTTPFQQAYDFLKRNAPKKRMVLSGWGGVVRHFEYFHKKLPLDIVFSALNDSLGWDPVSDVFERLEGRERWPIPWLEDDPAMWLPQFHVNRTQRDVDLASKYGCQGILGIHWRHRIMDATAGYLAKSAWDANVSPAAHFNQYANAQASGERAGQLGALLNDTDLHQKILHTGTDKSEDGHVVTREWTPDYGEGFAFWNPYEPDPKIVASQKQVAADLRKIADEATSPIERERTDYLCGFVEFAVPYTDAWIAAHRLNTVLESAAQLKAGGNAAAAKDKVEKEGVPLWLALAPLVRETMLRYQSIVATRNDLGQLASMHNKYVRLALDRLSLSILDYLGELPQEMEIASKEAMQNSTQIASRLFLPTRPGLLLTGERVRVQIVAAGNAPIRDVVLHTSLHGSRAWNTTPAALVGRQTYEAFIGPFEKPGELARYYVSASIAGDTHTAPAGAPDVSHFITVV